MNIVFGRIDQLVGRRLRILKFGSMPDLSSLSAKEINRGSMAEKIISTLNGPPVVGID